MQCRAWHYKEFFEARRSAAAAAGSSDQAGEADPKLQVRFADVGCGFGGLLFKLSPLYPDTLMVGMEIRDKVNMSYGGRVCCRACCQTVHMLLLSMQPCSTWASYQGKQSQSCRKCARRAHPGPDGLWWSAAAPNWCRKGET